MIGLIGVAGFLAGMAAARHFAAGGSGGSEARQAEHGPRMGRGSERPPASFPSRSEARGLPQMIRFIRLYGISGSPEIVREIERLSTAELRSLVEELVASRPRHYSEDSEALDHLIRAAIKEWYRREGEEALRRADELEEEDTRRMILSLLINAAAYENPELGKQWADRFREEHGKDWYRFVVYEAVRGAVSRSAEDFLKVRELFKDEAVEMSLQGPFAEDFDFRKVIAAMPTGHGVAGMVSRWAMKDPEAAWETAKEVIGEHGERAGNYVGNVFQGIARVKGDDEAAKWLDGSIGEVPQEVRRMAFQSLWGVEMLMPERSTAIMNALSDREDRVLFASMLLNPHNDRGNGLAGLRALDSDATRVEALMATAAKLAPGMGSGVSEHARTVQGYFDRTMEELALPAETRDRVKAALVPE